MDSPCTYRPLLIPCVDHDGPGPIAPDVHRRRILGPFAHRQSQHQLAHCVPGGGSIVRRRAGEEDRVRVHVPRALQPLSATRKGDGTMVSRVEHDGESDYPDQPVKA